MISDIIAFFNNLLGTGSAAVNAGSAIAGNVADIFTGSLGVDAIEPNYPA